MALLGWLIAIGLVIASWKAVSSGVLQKFYQPTTTAQKSTQLKSSPADADITAGQIKLATATQIAEKPTKTDDDRNQIMGLVNGALTDFKNATTKDPNNYLVWYYQGTAYEQLIGVAENSDKFAIDDFNKAVALNPSDYNSYLALGGVYYSLKQYDKAIENFQKVTQLQPKYANGFYNLGMAYKQVGAKDSAKQALQQALDLLDVNDPTRYKAESELNSI